MKKLTKKLMLYALLAFSLYGKAENNSVPYLQSPADSSIWISWKSEKKQSANLIYGTSEYLMKDTLSFCCDSLDNNFYYNSVFLTGLQPSKKYFYQIDTGDSISSTYHFNTQPKMNSKTGHYRILLWGDHQLVNSEYDNKWREDTLLFRAIKNAEKLYDAPIEDCINLIQCDGDQVDAGTLSLYENEHFRIGGRVSPNVPMMTCLGNHETYYDSNLNNYRNLFKYESINYGGIESPGGDLYYSYQEANIVFVIVNTEDNSEIQTQWVKKIVEAADADPNIDWIISVGHRPYNCEQYVGDYSKWFRESAMPILATSGKYVLDIGAHHHLYHRGQTREWPVYHICSGGASWDQYWGQSTEQDMDDIQKTIANWAYQIIDFDLDNKTMDVKSYSLGHPLLGIVYDDKMIDSFHRILDEAAPDAPKMIPIPTDTIILPYTFETSEYVTSTNELFNSTQFQISSSYNFDETEVDKIRDVENIYGDTGSPDYTPVDINDTVNILEYHLKEQKLSNGIHYMRARHRDTNAEWSDWSDTLKFVVKGSIDGSPRISISERVYFSSDGYEEIAPRQTFYVGSIPALSTDQDVYHESDSITVSYTNAPGQENDWIGIFKIGDEPEEVDSKTWSYVSGEEGIFKFKLNGKGYYFASYMVNNGFTEIASRANFQTGDTIVDLSMDKDTFDLGEDMTVNFNNGPGGSKDYIGIFRDGAVPGIDPLVTYKYVDGKIEGAVVIEDDIPAGKYFMALYPNDSYTQISNSFNFTVLDTMTTGIVDTQATKSQMNIYSNPSDGIINLKLTGWDINKKISIKVADIFGRIYYKNRNQVVSHSQITKIDLSAMVTGVYYVIVTSENKSQSQRVIIQ